MTATMSRPRSENNTGKLNMLCGLGCDRIEELFDVLEVDLTKRGKRYLGSCPIHGGSNVEGFNLYPDGDEVRGFWKCRTHHCENVFRSSLVGFVRGVLSHRKFDWGREGDRAVVHKAAVDWLCKFVGVEWSELKVDEAARRRARFTADVQLITKQGGLFTELCSRDQFEKMVDIPAHYYLERGYRESTIRTYNVGRCIKKKSEHYNRIVVPSFDLSYTKIVGAISRSLEPTCPKCKLCHSPTTPCPNPQNRLKYVRWRVVGNFNDKNYLYNVWRAKEAIKTSRKLVIVEGAGDVWRLEEGGVHNAVGLFGSECSDQQEILIQELMPRHIYLMADNDTAGRNCTEELKKRFRRFANIHVVEYEGSDVGDLSVDYIKKHVAKRIV